MERNDEAGCSQAAMPAFAAEGAARGDCGDAAALTGALTTEALTTEALTKVVRIEARAGLGRKVCAELRGYWEGLRVGQAVPARSEVDPRGIERALAYAFILERVAPGVARFRLAGTHLSDLLGMEVRTMPLSAFFTAGARQRVMAATEAVFQGPAIVDLALNSAPDHGRPALPARLLLLPLRSDFGDVSRALGCLVTEGQIGRAPRRFDLSHVDIQTIPGGDPGASAGGGARTPVAPALSAAAPGCGEKPAPYLLQQPIRPRASQDPGTSQWRVLASTDRVSTDRAAAEGGRADPGNVEPGGALRGAAGRRVNAVIRDALAQAPSPQTPSPEAPSPEERRAAFRVVPSES